MFTYCFLFFLFLPGQSNGEWKCHSMLEFRSWYFPMAASPLLHFLPVTRIQRHRCRITYSSAPAHTFHRPPLSIACRKSLLHVICFTVKPPTGYPRIAFYVVSLDTALTHIRTTVCRASPTPLATAVF